MIYCRYQEATTLIIYCRYQEAATLIIYCRYQEAITRILRRIVNSSTSVSKFQNTRWGGKTNTDNSDAKHLYMTYLFPHSVRSSSTLLAGPSGSPAPLPAIDYFWTTRTVVALRAYVLKPEKKTNSMCAHACFPVTYAAIYMYFNIYIYQPKTTNFILNVLVW